MRDSTKNLANIVSKGSAGTLALSISGMGLAFLAGLILARLLGAEGFGTFVWTMALVELFSVPVIMGWDNLLIRQIASYEASSSWPLVLGIIQKSQLIVFLFSVCFSIFSAALIWAFKEQLGWHLSLSLLVGTTILPVFCLLRITEAAIHGLRYVVIAHMPTQLLRPFLFIALLGIFAFLIVAPLSSTSALLLNLIAFIFCLLVAKGVLRRHEPAKLKTALSESQTLSWVHASIPLMLLGIIGLVNSRADVILLGMFMGSTDTGIYAAAMRGATLVTLVLIAGNTAMAPVVSRLGTHKKLDTLQDLIIRMTTLIFLCTVPIALGLIVFGEKVLLLFGPQFGAGYSALVILTVGQLLHVATGPAGMLLVMTGNESDAILSFGSGAALNLCLNAFLIPFWATTGAAIATALSLVITKVILCVRVRIRLGVHANPWSKLLWRTFP